MKFQLITTNQLVSNKIMQHRLKDPKIQVVIPAHNEARTIFGIVRKCLEYVDSVIVVDDSSSDDTAAEAIRAGAYLIQHQTNQGYLRSLKSGVDVCSGDIIVFLDGDGEHDPRDIQSLIDPIVSNVADFVFGTPGRPVRLSEGIICLVASLRLPIVNTGFGFRALRTDLAKRIPFRGRCGCGLMALDAQKLSARLVEAPVSWLPVAKNRRIGWFHIIQFVWILRGLAGL